MEKKEIDKKEEIATEVATNILVLSNGRKIKINPTKLKYFKSGDFNIYALFYRYKLEDILFEENGLYVKRFMSAVLDKPYTVKTVTSDKKNENGDPIIEEKYTFNKEVETIFNDEMTFSELKKFVDIALAVNEIDPKK